MNLIRSENESQFYNLEIYRSKGYSDQLDAKSLLLPIYQLSPDVVKLKINVTDRQLFNELNSLGFPFSIHSLISKNEVEIPVGYKYENTDEKITYRNAQKEDKQALREIIPKIISKPTGFNYQPLYSFNNSANYIENTIFYLESLIDNDNADVWLTYYDGQISGYFSGIFYEDYFEGILYGVVPEYRNKGISNYIYGTMKSICAEKNKKRFINDVQVTNHGSMKSASKIGMQGGMYYYIHLYCFFSNHHDLISKDSVIYKDNASLVDQLLKHGLRMDHQLRINTNTLVVGERYEFEIRSFSDFNNTEASIVKLKRESNVKGHLFS
ncbi:MAG: GNAT family N-acetyltransferase [Chitinophagales bacterium]